MTMPPPVFFPPLQPAQLEKRVFKAVDERLMETVTRGMEMDEKMLIGFWALPAKEQYAFFVSKEPLFELDGVTPGIWLGTLLAIDAKEASRAVRRYRELMKRYEGA